MGRLRLGVGAGAMALVLVVSACGGDNKPSSSSGTTSASGSGSASGGSDSSSASGTATSAAGGSAPVSLPGKVNDHGTKAVTDGGELEMELDDFYFGPTYVTGPAGAKVKINLSNEGQKNHTFTIDSAKIDQQVDPDQKATVEVTLPASGTLAFYCKFHKDAGMQGGFAVS
jgi:plastocyanin